MSLTYKHAGRTADTACRCDCDRAQVVKLRFYSGNDPEVRIETAGNQTAVLTRKG